MGRWHWLAFHNAHTGPTWYFSTRFFQQRKEMRCQKITNGYVRFDAKDFRLTLPVIHKNMFVYACLCFTVCWFLCALWFTHIFNLLWRKCDVNWNRRKHYQHNTVIIDIIKISASVNDKYQFFTAVPLHWIMKLVASQIDLLSDEILQLIYNILLFISFSRIDSYFTKDTNMSMNTTS